MLLLLQHATLIYRTIEIHSRRNHRRQ